MVFGLGFLHAVKFKGGEISLQCSVQTAPATASPANNAHQLTSRPDFLDNTIFPTTPHILLDHTFCVFRDDAASFQTTFKQPAINTRPHKQDVCRGDHQEV